MFSIVYLNFLDNYNFLAMPLDEMAEMYGCKTKTLYPKKYFSLDLLGGAFGLVPQSRRSRTQKLPLN